MRAAFSRLISNGRIVLALVVVVCMPAHAEVELSDSDGDAPRVLNPAFPLEPGKKQEVPIRPETFVSGPTEPPVAASAADDLPLSRRPDRDKSWQETLQLGWFMANQSGKHLFTGLNTSFGDVRRTNSNALALNARFTIRPPHSIFSALGELQASTGRADVKVDRSTVPLTRFDVQEFRGRAGVRLHALGAASTHGFAIGADIAAAVASYTTLNAAQTAVDVDPRRLIYASPRVVYHYAPYSNWAVELEGGYAFPVSSSGDGDVKASSFRRIEGEIRALRYLALADAIGFGVAYNDERITWTRSSPSALSDSFSGQDFRVNLHWSHDF